MAPTLRIRGGVNKSHKVVKRFVATAKGNVGVGALQGVIVTKMTENQEVTQEYLAKVRNDLRSNAANKKPDPKTHLDNYWHRIAFPNSKFSAGHRFACKKGQKPWATCAHHYTILGGCDMTECLNLRAKAAGRRSLVTLTNEEFPSSVV